MSKKKIDDEGMRAIAELLTTLMPENWGFTLLTFETDNKGAKVNYISSAERESMKGTMQTILDKWNRPDFFTNPNNN